MSLHPFEDMAVEPIFTALIVLVCRCFFARRAYELTGGKIYPLLIVLTAIVSAVGGILDAHELAATPNFSYLLDARVGMIIWIVPGLIPDFLIAAVHTCYFKSFTDHPHSHQHMRQFPKNITLYDHFLRAFIQTGLVLPIGGILGMILYFSSQRTGLYMLYSLPVSKVYSTTLMCCLNTRDGWNFKGYIDESAYSQQDDDILKPGEVLQFAPSQTTMTVTDTIF
ncbi:hypothetical protein D9613_005807 [Agrocybe pediades]|uniref:DUF6534 domain-containing protein n=1 Tax=Agrocybe pediades TaxID=84607 RepID=A0A8H4QVY8_9AGAR|nr:hypothetical protein D9613_005807 [Agrocybe pediades]